MTGQARQPHLTRGGRLLALLLAVLLSVTSLAGHEAMDACDSDCTTTQVEMVDNADPECNAWAALAATPVITSTNTGSLVGAFGPAIADYIPLPPRQPPRS